MPVQTVIAFVEDEPLIRLLGCEILSDAGYRVLEAANADEAMDALEAGKVDLMVSDIRMPGMTGLQLAARVHERWPRIKLLLTSGDTWPSRDEIPDNGHFLPKPYTGQQLRHEVETLLKAA